LGRQPAPSEPPRAPARAVEELSESTREPWPQGVEFQLAFRHRSPRAFLRPGRLGRTRHPHHGARLREPRVFVAGGGSWITRQPGPRWDRCEDELGLGAVLPTVTFRQPRDGIAALERLSPGRHAAV